MAESVFQKCCLLGSCLAFVHWKPSQTAHIVGFGYANLVSHHRLLWKFGQELQARGHQYTHILPSCAMESFSDVGVKIFHTSVTVRQIEDSFVGYSQVGEIESISGIFNLVRYALTSESVGRITERICEDFLKHKTLIAELKNVTDLVLCDGTNSCCYILVDLLNATRVDLFPHGVGGAYGSYLFSNPQAPVYLTLDSLFELEQSSKLLFINRLRGFVLYAVLWKLFDLAHFSHLWEKHARVNSTYTNAVTARKSFSIGLIPHDSSLDHPRPLQANIKRIGPITPQPAQELSDHLGEFMTRNDKVVVVSFGTALRRYPPSVVEIIADGLSKLSVAVLWKYTGDFPSTIGSNTKIMKWIPQNDILGHPSTKVFVTHGGLHSVQESAYHSVPMVVIPMFGDQFQQANMVKHKGLGIIFYSMPERPAELTDAVHEVLNNKVYRNNVNKISSLIKDRKQPPVKQGADWIEFALRHDGAAHLTCEAFDLPEYQLYMFDVFLFLVVSAFIIVFLCVRLCRCVKGRGTKFSKKEKQN